MRKKSVTAAKAAIQEIRFPDFDIGTGGLIMIRHSIPQAVRLRSLRASGMHIVSARMHTALRRLAGIAFVLFLAIRISAEVPALPAQMHEGAMRTIDLVFRERFDKAMREAKQIIKQFPGHPAGYFFYAVACDAWMGYYQSNSREKEFYQYCDQVIETGESMLRKSPDNPWVRFFMGGAAGFKGTYDARYERWITAFRHGWKGVSILKEIEKSHPDFPDILLGIGTYDYWRSSMTKMMWWMPGVEDRREEGIAALEKVRTSGIYVREMTITNLMRIYNNEKRFAEALALADTLLEKYPANLSLHWGKAHALLGLKRFEAAEKHYRYILDRVESEKIDNHYNAAMCRYYLAKIYYDQKRYLRCIAECNRTGYYQIDAETKKRLEKQFDEISDLKGLATALWEKSPKLKFVP